MIYTFESLLSGNNVGVDRRFVWNTFEEMKPKITKSFASKG